MHPQPELVTARLRLRPFRRADAPDVQRLAGTEAVASSTLSIPHPYPDGLAETWIAGHAPAWAEGRAIVHAITTAGDGLLVGAVGLALTPAHAQAELGYWIGERHWGQGYATEAAGALCAYAFATLDLHRIQARHFVRNPASGRVMQKIGLQREGTLRGAMRKWGRFEDLVLYAALAPDWMAAPPVPMPEVA
jgi:RimJ/RimL family protein N-acetyltransferase